MVATWALLSAFHHMFLFRRVNRTLFFQQAEEFWQASSQASAVGNPRGCKQPSFQHKPGVQLPFVLQTRWLKSSLEPARPPAVLLSHILARRQHTLYLCLHTFKIGPQTAGIGEFTNEMVSVKYPIPGSLTLSSNCSTEASVGFQFPAPRDPLL